MKKWTRARFQPNLPLDGNGYVTAGPAHRALAREAMALGLVTRAGRVHFFIAAENSFRSTGAHHYNTDGGKCDALFSHAPLFAGPLAPPVFLCYHAESPSQGVLRQHGKDTDR